jgi:hypothetical protein
VIKQKCRDRVLFSNLTWVVSLSVKPKRNIPRKRKTRTPKTTRVEYARVLRVLAMLMPKRSSHEITVRSVVSSRFWNSFVW